MCEFQTIHKFQPINTRHLSHLQLSEKRMAHNKHVQARKEHK